MKILGKGFDQKWIWSLVLGTTIGGAIFAAMIAWAGMGNVWQQMQDVDGGDLSIYVGVTMVTYLLRAWRFQLLIGDKGNLSKLYGVVSIHTLMINLLPFSSGELSYPLLLKRYGISHRFVEGVPSIVVARLQDLSILVALIIASLVWLGGFGLLARAAAGLLVPAVGLLTLVMAAGVFLYKGWSEKARALQGVRLHVARVLSSLKDVSRRDWLGSFSLALAHRLTSIIATWYLIRAVGVLLSLPTVFLICSLYVFLPLLPVNALAGLGITEVFLLAFFVNSGIDQGVATAASVEIHLLQLTIAASLAAIGTVQLQYLSYQERRVLL